MNWAQRLKRVFKIDLEVCSHCGGKVKVLDCIEEQPVIDQMLNHLIRRGTWLTPMNLILEGTGPPATQLFQSARVPGHIFKQPNQGSQATCFTPAEIYLKRHLKSLSIARFLLPKSNHTE